MRSLSHGMQSYINRVEEDTLSSYPLTIQEASIDVTSMLEAMMGNGEKEEHNDNKIYSRPIESIGISYNKFRFICDKVRQSH